MWITTRRNEVWMYLSASALVWGAALVARAATDDQKQRSSSSVPAKKWVGAVDMSGWKIKESECAVKGVRTTLGLPSLRDSQVQAELAVVEADTTPYLSGDIVDRPVWHVTVEDWSVVVPSLSSGISDRFVRTLDAYLDPTDGKLLKLETRWPAGEPPLGPPPSAETAVEQMRRSDNHVYHRFPAEPPKVTFLDALDAIVEQAGAQPTVARQIIAHYVVWSTTSRQPRAVWAITLRGIPPYFLRGRAVSDEPRFQLRYIVDATTGKFLRSSNAPGPVEPSTGGE